MKTSDNKEVRSSVRAAGKLEVRQTSQGRTVEGYAIVTEPATSENLGGFYERISKQALRDAMASNPDLFLLHGHDTNQVLARVSSGTMRTEIRAKGLWFSASLPNSPIGDSVAETLRRQDTRSCSFGFICLSDSWAQENGKVVRTVEQMEVMELTICAMPAYPDTESALRSAPTAIREMVTSKREDNEETCSCRCVNCERQLHDECAAEEKCDLYDDAEDSEAEDSRSLLINLITRRMIL